MERVQNSESDKKFRSTDEVQVGDVLDERYVLTEIVGRGGCGIVFRATDLNLARDVAVKVLALEGEVSHDAFAKFEQESQIMRRLHAANTVYFYDCGETPKGFPYIVMEFVTGKSLKDLLAEEGCLTPMRTVAILSQVLSSLAEAHEYGVVHRDLKPGNIMLCPRPGFPDDFVKVLDFGIAKIVSDEENHSDKDIPAGTPKYMPPEQFKCEPMTPRADLYSVGCIAYEMLTGVAPFDGESMHVMVAKHLFMTPRSLPADLDIYPNLLATIFKLLEKTPEDRFESASKVIEAFEHWNDPVLLPELAGCRTKGDDSQDGAFEQAPVPKMSRLAEQAVEAAALNGGNGVASVHAQAAIPKDSLSTNELEAIANAQFAGMAPTDMKIRVSGKLENDMNVHVALGDAVNERPRPVQANSRKFIIIFAAVGVALIIALMAIFASSSSDEQVVETVDLEPAPVVEPLDLLLVDRTAHSCVGAFDDGVAYGLQTSVVLMNLDDPFYEFEEEQEEVAQDEETEPEDAPAPQKAAAPRPKKSAPTNYEFKVYYKPVTARVSLLNAKGDCKNGQCKAKTISPNRFVRIVVSAPGYTTQTKIIKSQISEIRINLVSTSGR